MLLTGCRDLIQKLLVDHVDVNVNKIDAIVDRAGRGDVLDYGTWCLKHTELMS